MNIAPCDKLRQPEYRYVRHDKPFAACDNWQMDQSAQQYFAQWRKHRGLTQAEASRLTKIPQGYLSDLERGMRRYNQDHLEQMAAAYRCQTWELLRQNPLEPTDEAGGSAEIVDIWSHITPERRDLARRMLETLVDKKKA